MTGKTAEQIIDRMPSAIIVLDTEHRLIQLNRLAAVITGLDPNQSAGRPVNAVFPFISPLLQNICEHPPREPVIKRYAVPQSFPGGKYIFDILIYPLGNWADSHLVVRLDDVTEKTASDRNDRIISIGGLAAGLAHEINNPLAGMMQSTQVVKQRLLTKLPANLDAAEQTGISLDHILSYTDKRNIPVLLDSILKAGNIATGIIRKMLDLSLTAPGLKRARQLPALLDYAVALAQGDVDPKIKHQFAKIKILREYQHPMPEVACEETKILQAFLNILRNGTQAMDKAGTPEPQFILRIFTEENSACVEIENSGPGLDENITRRIFDPFFTTLEVGEGRGLGLSLAYHIVTKIHGGSLEVVSLQKRGMKFIITLPLQTGGETEQ